MSLEEEKYIAQASKHAPIDQNIEILFRDVRICDMDFRALFNECMEKTGTEVAWWKVLRRLQRAFNLAKYFDYALQVPGHRVECGVLRGFSARLMSRMGQIRDPAFDGKDIHLVDSFEGLSAPTEGDAMEYRVGADGQREYAFSHEKGELAASLEHVQGALADFPGLTYHKGWIPEIFKELPETTWSFVHIDVDLHDPTKACMEYFIPRLSDGGVIVNDDYSSPLFPGGGRAWRDYCEAHDLSYVVFDTGQAVFIKSD